MGLTREERETILRWDQADDMASAYTHDKGLISMLERHGFKAAQEYRNSGVVVAKHFEIPKAWISVRPPRKASPAVRAALAKARARQAEASAPSASPVCSETRARADDFSPNLPSLRENMSKARRSSL